MLQRVKGCLPLPHRHLDTLHLLVAIVACIGLALGLAAATIYFHPGAAVILNLRAALPHVQWRGKHYHGVVRTPRREGGSHCGCHRLARVECGRAWVGHGGAHKIKANTSIAIRGCLAVAFVQVPSMAFVLSPAVPAILFKLFRPLTDPERTRAVMRMR